MAGETWRPVTFNEGAPFDPNDLNQLQTNITQAFQQSKDILKNLLVGTDQSLLFAAGSLGPVAVTANTALPLDLPRDSKFGSKIPTYIVSIGSNIKSGTLVSVGVKDQETAPKAVIVSNKPDNFVVNYIAFAIQ